MKQLRMISLILCLALICGCSGKFRKDAVRFYYLRTEIEYSEASGVITSEIRDDADRSSSLLLTMEQYLEGPGDSSMHSPFPEEIQILIAEQQDDTVILEFNDVLTDLTGMDLTLACACAAMTCLELTDAENVSIRARGATLDGAAQITMNADSLLLLDSSGQ